MNIKLEDKKHTICSGCLSTDRAISPCVDYSLFFYLLGEQVTEMSKLLLCWECNTKIRKIKLFQDQIKHGHMALLQYFYEVNTKPSSLSSLTKVMKHDFDISYSYSDTLAEVSRDPEIVKEEPFQDCDGIDMMDDFIAKDEDVDTKLEYTSPYTSGIDTATIDTASIDNQIKKTKRKKSSKNGHDIKIHSIKHYEKYATITKTQDIPPKADVSQFYERVVLGESEIEDVLAKHRKNYGYFRVQFKCEVCRRSYKRKTDLNRHHDLNHKKSPPFKCSECDNLCQSESHLRTHWLQHSEMVRCLSCWDVYRTPGELRKHLNRDHTRVYACPDCGTHCSNLRKFSQHYHLKHEGYICDHCQRRFSTKRTLEKHMLRQHLPPTCHQCRRQFVSFRSLQRHRILHTNPSNVEGAYCVECDKQFPTVYKYRSHIKCSPKHTPQPKLKVPCPDCGKVFTRKNYMNNHFKQVHAKTTRHYCELCNKLLITAFALRNHMKHVHEKKTLPKNKICDLCGRGFSTNRILINHIRTHTGERPHKCFYCPASFAQKTAMKSHEKSQHTHQTLNKLVQ